MSHFKKAVNYTGLAVLIIASIVYFMTAERTGSLWDCGEFILGAYKLQVVHPPGAGLFILVGRLFTVIAEIISDNPSDIAFAVNLMSGLCSALTAMFICWATMMFGNLALVGRDNEASKEEVLALTFAGLVAGLATAFSTSIWFSGVEGEVYAMSSLFTAMTIWSATKWYHLPDSAENDRWLILSFFVAGLSVGIHLLSILTFPTIALLYYFKKYNKHSITGALVSMGVGVFFLVFVMKFIIVGIPVLWKNFELFMVNDLGMPVHSGLIPALMLVAALSYYLFRYAYRKKNQILQNLVMISTLMVIAYSTIGVVVIRANADTPVNMNTPSNAMRLIPYLNREQYGERPLVKGPHYMARPVNLEKEERYDLVGDRYQKVDEKFDYLYRDSDKLLFPRIGHPDRADLHNAYRQYLMGNASGKPNMAYNMKFMFHYQFGWMYWRYFMWNFAGRQNSDQGVFTWNVKEGNWLSGIDFIDEARLHNFDKLPDRIKNEESRNKYYFIPLLLGILGLVFHYTRKRKDFLAVALLFVIAGLGIIIYSNQPPQEPRERDYVLVGSFMTFCIWIGMGVLAIFSMMKERFSLKGMTAPIIAGALALTAPLIMGFQNYDDHDRSEHFASRDYAANFLNSVDENAIIFTYGDNDTYPLWYAQEVEGIRRDVRVVNLSLIQVDWYINKLRNKVNDSPPIKLTINADAYRGKNLNQIFFPENRSSQALNLLDALAAMNGGVTQPQWPSSNFIIPIDSAKVAASGIFDTSNMRVENISISLPPTTQYITKDEIAILDVIASNIYERPVYFAVTCKNEKLMRLNDYMQLEGLALRVIPSRTPSDRSLAIYGSGRAAPEKAYDNIMNKWAWGNFDKVETHIDKSYMAEVQAMKYTMLRTALAFIEKGDKKRAADVANKYFEGFPNFNFGYDAGISPFIGVLVQAEDFESAKANIRILANEMVQNGEFLLSLDMDDLQSFSMDLDLTAQGIGDAVAYSNRVNDEAFAAEIAELTGSLPKQLSDLRNQLNAN